MPVKQAGTKETLFADHRAQGHNRKIEFQELPKHIASGLARAHNFAVRAMILIGHDHCAASKSGFGMRLKGFNLEVERTGKPQIVIIQKSYIAGSADQDADVARSGYALISLHSNVVYAWQVSADCGSFIGRRIVNDNNFHLGTG